LIELSPTTAPIVIRNVGIFTVTALLGAVEVAINIALVKGVEVMTVKAMN